MKSRSIPLAALATFMMARPAPATVLLTDNFNTASNYASSFNDYLSSDQGGTLAVTTYSVQGSDFVAQHSNGSRLLVATDDTGNYGNGSVSLNNNFATQANATNQALQITFNIHSVGGYSDASRWVQFNVGNSQSLDVGAATVGTGVLFRVNGGTQLLSSGIGIGNIGTWAADDLVTITLTGTSGVGSAFNGNGSKANISIGATNYGSFTLAQQTNAYLTFSAFNYASDQFGLGTFDNLTVALVPEPGAALLGGLGLLALLRRRR